MDAEADARTEHAEPATAGVRIDDPLRTAPMGWAAIAGAVAASIANLAVLLAAVHAPVDTVSYPLSPGAFRAGQVFFAGTQLLMTLGMVGLERSGAAGAGPWARRFGGAVIVGYAITVVGELVLIPVATASIDATGTSAATSVFGIGVLIADIGLIGYGVLARRAAVWGRGWATLLIALGIFQLLVVTPVAIGAGFASGAAFAVITAQNALIVALGWKLTRPRAIASPIG